MTGATISTNISNGSVISFNIISAGSDYDSNVKLYIHPPSNTGTQCIAHAELDSNGSIIDIVIDDGGSGYLDNENPLCLVFESVNEGIIQLQGWKSNLDSITSDDKYKLLDVVDLKNVFDNLLKKGSITIQPNQSQIYAFSENGNIIIHTDKLNGYAHGFCNTTESPTLYTHSLVCNFIGFKQSDINYILIENNSNQELIFTIKIFQ